MQDSSDLEAVGRGAKKDHVHSDRHTAASSDPESRSRFTRLRMLCQEFTPLANRTQPFACGVGVILRDEFHDGEQIGPGTRGKPRPAHALPARSMEAMRSSALAKTVSAAAVLPSSS